MVGDAYVVCMRVVSSRMKQFEGGEVGYLHPIGSTTALPRPVRREPEAPLLHVAETLRQWRSARQNPCLDELSMRLGVTKQSLEALECTKALYAQTWAFPMRSGDGHYVGIRLRNIGGDKWAERGSKQGLFIPQSEPSRTILIVEGPTDAAAALTIGYWAIGRPSCCGGVDQLKIAMKYYSIRRAVIVSDLDDPGLRGANTLALHLSVPTAILVCPSKDIRAFVNQGGNKEMMDAMIGCLTWRMP